MLAHISVDPSFLCNKMAKVTDTRRDMILDIQQIYEQKYHIKFKVIKYYEILSRTQSKNKKK